MDYLIAEAVSIKVARLDHEAHELAVKDAEMKQRKKDAQKELHKMFN